MKNLLNRLAMPVIFRETPDGGGGGTVIAGTAGDDTVAAEPGKETALGGDTVKTGEDTTTGGDTVKTGEDTTTGGDTVKTGEDTVPADDPLQQVPEDGKYEFGDLPEGIQLSEEDTAAWSEQFKELGLTRAQAGQLVQMQANRVADDVKQRAEAVQKQEGEHLDAAKKDPDIGGDKWDESVLSANRALTMLRGGPKGDPEAKNEDGSSKGLRAESALESLILSTGNGNNPEVIRELRRVGDLLKDDKFMGGKGDETIASTEERWYGDTTPSTKKG